MKKTMMALCLSVLPALGWTTSLTIYNQNFALIKEDISVTLNKPLNDVNYSNITYGLEPESVVLRSKNKGDTFQILEQTYLAEPVSVSKMLDYFEGQTIDFLIDSENGTQRVVQGKIVRSGKPYGFSKNNQQPMIEIDNKLRFGLPGVPLFPSTDDDLLLKPTLVWKIKSTVKKNVDAQLSYLTKGAKWESTYNLVVDEKDESKVTLVGWVTLTNNTGKDFKEAAIKLMAGDVNRATPEFNQFAMRPKVAMMSEAMDTGVEEKSLDEFHLYTLKHKTDLSSGETKQVEFIRSESLTAKKVYVFDGRQASFHRGHSADQQLSDVAVYREFMNNKKNGLGVALPKGELKFYQQTDGDIEFIGENRISHTPKDEKISVLVGNAFDVKGKRVQTSYKSDNHTKRAEETIEITLKNRKDSDVEVLVTEYLNRHQNWKIVNSSVKYEKKDSQRVDFKVPVPAGKEVVLTYTAKYSW